jgi:hypothetical protein
MADQLFMYAIVTGVFAAFAAVLFTARAKRHHLSKIITEIDR